MAKVLTGLFGGNKQTSPPAIAARINSSVQGLPVPFLLGGLVRIGGTVIDYFDFISYQLSDPSSGGKGGVAGGGGKGQGTTGYSASIDIAICAGPIDATGTFFTNGAADDGVGAAAEVFLGTFTQGPWGAAEAFDPNRTNTYRGIAHFGLAGYALGSSPTLPNVTVLVASTNIGFLPGRDDGDPTQALIIYLTDPFNGLGFPSGRIGTLAGTPSSWQSYAKALGLAVSPVLTAQVQGSAPVTDLLTATNSEAVWQDGLFTVIPYGDRAIQQGQVSQISEPHTVPVAATNAQSSIQVGNSGSFVADKGVTYASGAPLLAVNQYPTVVGTYFYAGNGIYWFSFLDNNQSINIAYTWAATASYTPNVESVYDFTLDDYLPNQGTIGQGLSGGSSPLAVVRKSRDLIANDVKVEFLDSANNYNPVVVERMAEAQIVRFGRTRAADTRQLHLFTLASAAVQSCQLQLIRQQSTPRQYQWTVGGHFILVVGLMDVVTHTLPQRNMLRRAVRVTEILENQDGSLTYTGEDFAGTASSPVYGTQATSGFGLNFNANPGAINPPIIFEPTDELAATMIPGGGLCIAAAVSGQNTELYGGCNVWASYDPAGPYQQVASIFGASRMGVLTAPLPGLTANPTGQTIDQVNTLAVDLSESLGTLDSGTVLDATSLNTRCIVGGTEVVAYETATLTATSKYNLTYLVRGAYGTEDEIATWPAGATFARLDAGVQAFHFDQSRIGATLYLKFQAFNTYRGGAQDLSEISAVTYTITGSALYSPLPDVANLRTAYLDGRTKIDWDEIDDFRSVMYEIRLGASWASGLTLGIQAHPPFAVPGDGQYWVAAVSQPAAGRTIYSETPSSILIEGSLISGNILIVWDEAGTGWSGTFTGGAGKDATINAIRTGGAGNILTDPSILTTPDVLDFGGEGNGSYEIPASHWIDAGYNTQLALGVAYQGQGVPVGQNILTIADFLNTPDILGSASTQYVDVHIEVAIGQDSNLDVFAPADIYAEPDAFRANITWSAWQKFTPGVYPGRFAKFRVILNTIDPATIAYCVKFIFQALIPARVDQVNNVTVPASGLAITFTPNGTTTPRPFNGGPKVSGSSSNANVPAWNASITNATPGDDVIVSNLTLTGCTVFVQNGGIDVTRAGVNLQFFGY